MNLPVKVSSLDIEAKLNPVSIKPSHTKKFIPNSVAFSDEFREKIDK